jgi:hypothetical protein
MLLITFMLEKPADTRIDIAVRCSQRALCLGAAEAHGDKTAAVATAAAAAAAKRAHLLPKFQQKAKKQYMQQPARNPKEFKSVVGPYAPANVHRHHRITIRMAAG